MFFEKIIGGAFTLIALLVMTVLVFWFATTYPLLFAFTVLGLVGLVYFILHLGD